MTRKQIDELRSKQADAEQELGKAKQEAERLAQAEEPIPDDLKERAVKLRDEVVRLGTEIGEAETAYSKGIEENNEFLRSLTPELNDTVRTTIGTRRAPGRPSEPVTLTQITRETVDLFTQRMRDQYGSGNDSPYHYDVDQDSERLALDALACPNEHYVSRRGEFEVRRKRTAGYQLRHANAVEAGGGDPGGGFIMPEDNTFMREVQMAMLAHGGVVNVARVIPTQTGRALPIPTIDDTAATGSGRLPENDPATDVTLAFGEKQLNAVMITSGRLSATMQAIEDAGPNLPMLLGLLAAERIQRQESRAYVKGSGAAGHHQGLENAFQVDGYTFHYDRGVGGFTVEAAAGGNTALPMWPAFIDIKYAVNAAYRSSPRFSLVASDQLDQFFARAVDADGRPIFKEWGLGNTAMGMGMRYGGINILADYSIDPVSLAADSAGNEFGWVGDFNWFWIRRVAGMVMNRDPYTNAANFAVNWTFGRRSDSAGLFNTGANAAVQQIALNVKA